MYSQILMEREPRVKTASKDPENKLPWKRVEEWRKKIQNNMERADNTYYELFYKCVDAYNFIKKTNDNKRRHQAKSLFCHLFPKLMTIIEADAMIDDEDDLNMIKKMNLFYMKYSWHHK